MKEIPEIKLNDIVAEQEAAVVAGRRARVARLVGEKIQRRERLIEQLNALSEELIDVNDTIEKLRGGDWAQIDWKADSAEG